MKDALMLHVAKPIEADLMRPISDTGLRQVERFLYREAGLLDHEDYHAWLETLEADIHYWMPGIETRRRGEERGAYQYGEMAYFDDDLTILKIRVARYDQPTAWADNPATRHIHQITNVEAFETSDESLSGVFSCFTNIRNRNLKDQDILSEKLNSIYGARVVTVIGDVRSWQSNVEAVAAVLQKFGKLDTLIPNAGVYDFGRRLEDIPGEDLSAQFDELFGIDVKGYLLAVRAAIEPLRSSRGSVIFTLSSSSFYTGGGGILYVTAKHGLVGTVRALAYELAPEIRVNAVAPGGTRTGLKGLQSSGSDTTSLDHIAGFGEMVAKTVPLGFLSEPEDHAGLYVTLASREMSRFVTAAIIPSDGGLEVRGGGRRRAFPDKHTDAKPAAVAV